MPLYRMITNRVREKDRLSGKRGKRLSFWTSDAKDLTRLSAWTRLQRKPFYDELKATAGSFPEVAPEAQAEQKHVTLFVHGYNTDWEDAVRLYQRLVERLFSGPEELGLLVLFTWPSDGMLTNYLPDRADAEHSAAGLVEILSDLYDWLLDVQMRSAKNPKFTCRAKTSVIAHSMGNYVLQRAAHTVWTRKNQPLLVSLINQLLMVAADVDNDLFSSGEKIDKSDGDALANLTYRITALYSGYDQVLGLSAGLKHFGKRRLGRSGLDPHVPAPDNVWDIDCSPYFSRNGAPKANVHSAYFQVDGTVELMRRLLRGVDRKILVGV